MRRAARPRRLLPLVLLSGAVAARPAWVGAQPITPAGRFGAPAVTPAFSGAGIPRDSAAWLTLPDGPTLVLAATPHNPADVDAVRYEGEGVWRARAGLGASQGTGTPGTRWNFSFAILGDGFSLFDYKLYYDVDPAAGTRQSAHGIWIMSGQLTCDETRALHGFGGAAAQGSENPAAAFLTGGPFGATEDGCVQRLAPDDPVFDPDAPGEYSFALAAFDGTGREMGRVAIVVRVVP